MTHHKVDSSNIYSIAHEGEILEARFKCGTCCGTGKKHSTQFFLSLPENTCERCKGTGHTGTYRYHGVPATVFAKVATGEPKEKDGKPSVGAAFHRLIRGSGVYREEKVK